MNTEFFSKFDNKDFSKFSDFLFNLNPYEFTLIAPLIGSIISKNLTIDQQNSIGNFFELLGQTILTIAAQAQIIEDNKK